MTACTTENDASTAKEEEDAIPPLRYLGDKQLMQRQPVVTPEELQSESFQQKLKMLPQAMKKYGGIGIAAHSS